MKKNRQTCYMCDEFAVTREHVPPQCLFPESKDLQPGEDLRKNLISVPSCNEHNTAKSKDDAYFWYTVMMCQDANNRGQEHFVAKGARSIQRNPSLLKLMLEDSAPAIADEPQGAFKTTLVRPDPKRLSSFAEKMARALYYHHFQRKWTAGVVSLLEFLFHVDEGQEGINYNRAVVAAIAEKLTATAAPCGENPEVFEYRAAEVVGKSVIRARIYGDAHITMIFDPDETVSSAK